jgi:crotonobetainyl-CoA:carnitine CoA-transferase CaiB-like acyl-CoA transferase
VRAGPGRLWTSITGYGRAHEWIAYGDDAAVAAGLAWSSDPEVDGPVFPADALADPLTGLHTAAIVLAHLQSGRGGLLDIALHDVAAHAGAFEVETARLRVQSAEGAHARNGSVAGDGINADSPHGWIIDGADRIAISAPRARSIRAVAPALETANERSLAAWMAAC